MKAGQNIMIKHDNNTVYFFPNKKAAKIFSAMNRESFMYPDGLYRTYRDYNGGIYFLFHLTYHTEKLSWTVWSKKYVKAKRLNVLVYTGKRSE